MADIINLSILDCQWLMSPINRQSQEYKYECGILPVKVCISQRALTSKVNLIFYLLLLFCTFFLHDTLCHQDFTHFCISFCICDSPFFICFRLLFHHLLLFHCYKHLQTCQTACIWDIFRKILDHKQATSVWCSNLLHTELNPMEDTLTTMVWN